MSWYGTHYSVDSEIALRHVGYNCRRCKYKARLQFDAAPQAMWADHICSRCGEKFPASDIIDEKWYFTMRNTNERMSPYHRFGEHDWTAVLYRVSRNS